MKISNKFPQFERFPALLITSGEYEARFYVAFQGKLEQKEILKMPPRENAKEKQGFVGHKSGMQSLSATGHRENYIEQLKSKFYSNMHSIIHNILSEMKMDEIYIFAPKFVIGKILSSLNENERKKVRMQFYKEYTKQSPLLLLKIFNQELENIQKMIVKTPKEQNLFFHA